MYRKTQEVAVEVRIVQPWIASGQVLDQESWIGGSGRESSGRSGQERWAEVLASSRRESRSRCRAAQGGAQVHARAAQ